MSDRVLRPPRPVVEQMVTDNGAYRARDFAAMISAGGSPVRSLLRTIGPPAGA